METGQRISILKKDQILSIVILPTDDKKKLLLLLAWLAAWTICGIIVLANYFKIEDPQAKVYLIVYLSFWAYFEFNIARTYIWKRFGKEKLWIKEGKLHYQREVNRRGKIKEFNLDLISPLRMVALSTTRFADFFSQSFWVKGGERLEFDAQSQVVRLGMQLSDEEARLVLNEVKAFIKQ